LRQLLEKKTKGKKATTCEMKREGLDKSTGLVKAPPDHSNLPLSGCRPRDFKGELLAKLEVVEKEKKKKKKEKGAW